jgi:flagellar basal-body rod protein FlgG
MLEGLYSAASGMAAQQTRLDAVSNDLANASTTGYRPVRVAFRDLAYAAPGNGALAGGPAVGAGAAAGFAGRSTRQGALQQTGQPLDLALEGPGYLEVRRADGSTALTRDGALHLDGAGRLVTAAGDAVQPAITVPAGLDATQLKIAPDGTVAAGTRTLGRLSLVDVPAPAGLRAAGDSLLVPTAASGAPRASARTTVSQGALEASAVDMGEAMVDMIDAQRSFELASRAIHTQDQILEIANGVKR